jgi:hypothetical protein
MAVMRQVLRHAETIAGGFDFCSFNVVSEVFLRLSIENSKPQVELPFCFDILLLAESGDLGAERTVTLVAG